MSLKTNGRRVTTVKPTHFLTPYRVAAASISSSTKNNAAQVQPHGASTSLLKPQRKEVPLASQEGTKGVVQYALYVSEPFPRPAQTPA